MARPDVIRWPNTPERSRRAWAGVAGLCDAAQSFAAFAAKLAGATGAKPRAINRAALDLLGFADFSAKLIEIVRTGHLLNLHSDLLVPVSPLFPRNRPVTFACGARKTYSCDNSPLSDRNHTMSTSNHEYRGHRIEELSPFAPPCRDGHVVTVGERALPGVGGAADRPGGRPAYASPAVHAERTHLLGSVPKATALSRATHRVATRRCRALAENARSQSSRRSTEPSCSRPLACGASAQMHSRDSAASAARVLSRVGRTAIGPAGAVAVMNSDSLVVDASPTSPLALDVARYREHIGGLDLTEEQERELLTALWNILVTFVDLGFGVESVQRVLPELVGPASEAIGEECDEGQS